MKRKLYAKYNKRARQIEFVFVDINDDEALFKYHQANEEAELKNKYYRSEDYLLICLGVLNMEGKEKEVGIIYEYSQSFPFIFDNIDDNQKPQYNQRYFESMKVDKEKQFKIIEKAQGGEE